MPSFKKKKAKFRNAEQAKEARALAESWAKLLTKHEVPKTKRRKVFTPLVATNLKSVLDFESDRDRVPLKTKARPDPVTQKGVPPTKPRLSNKYTGSKMKGVAQMHKSNQVPTFSDEEIKEIATMRRN